MLVRKRTALCFLAALVATARATAAEPIQKTKHGKDASADKKTPEAELNPRRAQLERTKAAMEKKQKQINKFEQLSSKSKGKQNYIMPGLEREKAEVEKMRKKIE